MTPSKKDRDIVPTEKTDGDPSPAGSEILCCDALRGDAGVRGEARP
jgi:hypothetical protein